VAESPLELEAHPPIQPPLEAPAETELAPTIPAQPEATIFPSEEEPPVETLPEIPAEAEMAPEEIPLVEPLPELQAETELAPPIEPSMVLPAEVSAEPSTVEPLPAPAAETEFVPPVEPVEAMPDEPLAPLPPEIPSEFESPPFAQLPEEMTAEPELAPLQPEDLAESVLRPEEEPILLPLPEAPDELEEPPLMPEEIPAAVQEPEAQPIVPLQDELPAGTEIAPSVEPLSEEEEEPELVSPVGAEPAESIPPTQEPTLAQAPAEQPAEPDVPPLAPELLVTTINTDASPPAIPGFVVVSTEEELTARVSPAQGVPSESQAPRRPAITEFVSTISTFEEPAPFPVLPQRPAAPVTTPSSATEPTAAIEPPVAQSDVARPATLAEAQLTPAVAVPAEPKVQSPAPPKLEIPSESVPSPLVRAEPTPAIRRPSFQPPAVPAVPTRPAPAVPLPPLAEVPLVDVLFAQMSLMSGASGGPRPAPLATVSRPISPAPHHGTNEPRPTPPSPAQVPIGTIEPIGSDVATPQIDLDQEASDGEGVAPVPTGSGSHEEVGERRPPQLRTISGGKGIEDVHHRIWQRMEESNRQKAGQGSRVGLWTVAVAIFLIIGAGVGYAVYSWINADTPPDEWAVFQTPDRVCSVSMPGVPTLTEGGDGKAQKYTLTHPQDQLTFVVQCQDVDPTLGRPSIDDITRNEIRERRGKEIKLAPVASGVAEGREAASREANGEVAVSRIYLVLVGSRQRLYQATIRGPQVRPGEGVAARFLRSVVLTPGRSSLPARSK
jgi:hypothetical protein